MRNWFWWLPLLSLFIVFFFGIVAVVLAAYRRHRHMVAVNNFVPAQSTLIICSCLAFKPVLKPEAASSLFPLHSFLILKRCCRRRRCCRCYFIDDKQRFAPVMRFAVVFKLFYAVYEALYHFYVKSTRVTIYILGMEIMLV